MGQPSHLLRSVTVRHTVFCVDPGTYGIKVTDASGARADVRNDYELSVSTGPEPDALEPNNKVETAVPLTSGTAQTGYIACASDQDWYTFQTDKRLLVTLDFEMEKAAFQPFIQLSNAEGDIILNLSNQGLNGQQLGFAKPFRWKNQAPISSVSPTMMASMPTARSPTPSK